MGSSGEPQQASNPHNEAAPQTKRPVKEYLIITNGFVRANNGAAKRSLVEKSRPDHSGELPPALASDASTSLMPAVGPSRKSASTQTSDAVGARRRPRKLRPIQFG
jgi:hypothetical protein